VHLQTRSKQQESNGEGLSLWNESQGQQLPGVFLARLTGSSTVEHISHAFRVKKDLLNPLESQQPDDLELI
jgi:hypothetical protein